MLLVNKFQFINFGINSNMFIVTNKYGVAIINSHHNHSSDWMTRPPQSVVTIRARNVGCFVNTI